jgi:putative Ca2+/H+ antiporter (TMEM165/GDT1 family)
VFDAAVIATVFGLIFVGELPDKTAVASLVLGTRYPWRWAYTGIAVAFATHVVIAVSAGSLLALLPQRALEVVVAVLFLLGAVLIWRAGQGDEPDAQARTPERSGPAVPDGAPASSAAVAPDAGFWRVAGLGYGVIFVAEWGDLTQILIANLAAKYHSPISVGVGAALGLWSVGLLAILGGRSLLRVLPLSWITRAAALVLIALGLYSVLEAGLG